MKELSIVIVSWNSCDLTLACLKSACQAAGELIDNRQRDVQIILVDNGSDDGTIERVSRHINAVGRRVGARRSASNK